MSAKHRNTSLPVELPSSVPEILPGLQSNFTKWTSGDSPKTFRKLKSPIYKKFSATQQTPLLFSLYSAFILPTVFSCNFSTFDNEIVSHLKILMASRKKFRGYLKTTPLSLLLEGQKNSMSLVTLKVDMLNRILVQRI